MRNEFMWCVPTTCPTCSKTVNHVRFDTKASMCTLWCGCRITLDAWNQATSQPTKCGWCGTEHVPGKGCSA